ncbi:hypothetical protein TNCV_3911281 [Trichonephila clavipes]|nr:hypothetical protein TNCV_3911281 [Trichonephila clavipes]
MIVQFRNEKVINDGSIPITIDCNVVAFIVFEEGFHQPIKRTKQFINITLQSNRRATGNGPLNSDAKPSVENDTSAIPPLSRLQHRTRGWTFSLDRLNVHQSLYTTGLCCTKIRTHDTPAISSS